MNKLWKYALAYDVNWLAKPLTWILTNYWAITYKLLDHMAIPYNRNRVIEFTFDLGKLGDLSP